MDTADAPGQELGDRFSARRRLLRMGAYLAPAVLGSFIVSRTAEALSCLPAYCGPTPPCAPNTCQPDICRPFFQGGVPCSPANCRPDVCNPAIRPPRTCRPRP